MLLTHSHTFSISLPHRALSLITSLPSPSLRTKFTCIQCHDASRRTILNLSSHSRDLSTLSQIILPNISWSNPFACLPRYVQSALLCPIGSNSGLCRSFSSLFSFLKFKISLAFSPFPYLPSSYWIILYLHASFVLDPNLKLKTHEPDIRKVDQVCPFCNFIFGGVILTIAFQIINGTERGTSYPSIFSLRI